MPRPALLLAALLAFPGAAAAHGRSTGTAFRDLEARMRESYAAEHVCPATGRRGGHCPGYAVYYVPPSQKARPRDPWEMAWMTEAELAAARAEWVEVRGRAP